ncbi:MAG: lysine--tRNA ligase [Pseudomonadota bacterium]
MAQNNKILKMSDSFSDHITQAKSWPFEEARKIAARLKGKTPEKGYVLFETGYGPSGLPHIGTFGEVARTTMVRHAFELLTQMPTKLFAFSDDMDGFRKVPTNLPNQEMLAQYIGKPLTQVPDPFDKYESFAHHNNAKLQKFLDEFGFEYDFKSATECYKSGEFDQALLLILQKYDDVMQIILPTLREERKKTYSPFLPISPKSGHVLQVPMEEVRADQGTVIFRDEDGDLCEVPVTGGHCKLQWKVDWAMRWFALGVDYEMSGKDLIDSVKAGNKIVRKLGGTPPEGFNYELFLDENGEKISKSKGNGLSLEEWLTYATPESLSLYMFQNPKRAKRLYFDVIPKASDEYIAFIKNYHTQPPEKQLDNPAFHIHQGEVPDISPPVTFNMLLNLVSASNAMDKAILWGFITRYAPDATPQSNPYLDKLVDYAVRYFQDFIAPHKKFRTPTEAEKSALDELKTVLADIDENHPFEDIQTLVFTVGKNHNYTNLREWFGCLYETLLGQKEGPRMGSFIALYTPQKMIELIDQALYK